METPAYYYGPIILIIFFSIIFLAHMLGPIKDKLNSYRVRPPLWEVGSPSASGNVIFNEKQMEKWLSEKLEDYLFEDLEEVGDEPEKEDDRERYVTLSDSSGMEMTMRIAMMLDAKGEETMDPEETVLVLAQDKKGAWYEISFDSASWYSPTFH